MPLPPKGMPIDADVDTSGVPAEYLQNSDLNVHVEPRNTWFYWKSDLLWSIQSTRAKSESL